ncbi:hypothetical protein [Nonomuraea helvata]|uniref:Uncharacterized protein n=1 Tax=Nonomuraea helvata TaxID=37484 RepID=A0ABV5RY66_9ACTN
MLKQDPVLPVVAIAAGADVMVIAASAGLIIFLAWYFFGPKKSHLAEMRGRVQEAEVTVKGGYS